MDGRDVPRGFGPDPPFTNSNLRPRSNPSPDRPVVGKWTGPEAKVHISFVRSNLSGSRTVSPPRPSRSNLNTSWMRVLPRSVFAKGKADSFCVDCRPEGVTVLDKPPSLRGQ